ncbi:MAG: cupin domain-containing protein [Clostridiales bacterium]|nr:cupin domain-containing protein [Clostridiales bacterium]
MNIFDLPALPLPEESTTVLAGGRGVRIERIVSAGQSSDWYDQEEAEFVALLEGSAVIAYADGRSAALEKGDTLLIHPHERHRVESTSAQPPCVWLCVFFVT